MTDGSPFAFAQSWERHLSQLSSSRQTINSHRSTIRRTLAFNAFNLARPTLMMDEIDERLRHMIAPGRTTVAEQC